MTHILVIVLVILIFARPTSIPALGRSIGKAIRNFKASANEIDAEVTEITDAKHAGKNRADQMRGSDFDSKTKQPKNKS